MAVISMHVAVAEYKASGLPVKMDALARAIGNAECSIVPDTYGESYYLEEYGEDPVAINGVKGIFNGLGYRVRQYRFATPKYRSQPITIVTESGALGREGAMLGYEYVAFGRSLGVEMRRGASVVNVYPVFVVRDGQAVRGWKMDIFGGDLDEARALARAMGGKLVYCDGAYRLESFERVGPRQVECMNAVAEMAI